MTKRPRRTMPRWTRPPEWIPERFQQHAVNRTKRAADTKLEDAIQIVRMVLNRKIPPLTAEDWLENRFWDEPRQTDVGRYTNKAISILRLEHDGDITREEAEETLNELEQRTRRAAQEDRRHEQQPADGQTDPGLAERGEPTERRETTTPGLLAEVPGD